MPPKPRIASFRVTEASLVKPEWRQKPITMPNGEYVDQLAMGGDKGMMDIFAMKMLEHIRWGDEGPQVCPQCGKSATCRFLNPANGLPRKTRTGSMSIRRVWQCALCRKQFSVWTGTVFHRARLRPTVIINALLLRERVTEAEFTKERIINDLGLDRRHTAFDLWYRMRTADADDPLVGAALSLKEKVQRVLDQMLADGKVEAAYQLVRSKDNK